MVKDAVEVCVVLLSRCNGPSYVLNTRMAYTSAQFHVLASYSSRTEGLEVGHSSLSIDFVSVRCSICQCTYLIWHTKQPPRASLRRVQCDAFYVASVLDLTCKCKMNYIFMNHHCGKIPTLSGNSFGCSSPTILRQLVADGCQPSCPKLTNFEMSDHSDLGRKIAWLLADGLIMLTDGNRSKELARYNITML
jgi:hypothetical protein